MRYSLAALLTGMVVGVGQSAETAPPPRPKPTYYFPTTVGTKWVYQERLYGEITERWTQVVTQVKEEGVNRTVTVERIEKDGKVTAVEVFRVGDGELHRLSRNDVEDDPPLCLFVSRDLDRDEILKNFKVGDPLPRQSALIMKDLEAGRPVAWGSTPSLVGVTAGVFPALSVGPPKGANRGLNNLMVPFQETFWYSPGIGLIKKTSTQPGKGAEYPGLPGGRSTVIEIELISFTPGKK